MGNSQQSLQEKRDGREEATNKQMKVVAKEIAKPIRVLFLDIICAMFAYHSRGYKKADSQYD
jgi:hypothetical protein